MVFQKYAANPILRAGDFHDDIMYVFNPGAIKVDGEYLMIVNAATAATPIIFWLARSSDGIHFTPDPAPLSWPKYATDPEFCIYDPRITYLDGEYFLMYGAMTRKRGVHVGLVKTKDFQHFTRIEQPESTTQCRNGALFPEKIGGRYVRFDRPMPGELDPADMCISYSHDLENWSDSKILIKARESSWDNHKLGAGAVPIKTPQGWLEIYHGVDGTACNGFIYRLGVMLLDLADPSKVIARGDLPVLWPTEPYEFNGRTPNVVFTANAIVEPDNTVKIYYGAADCCVGLATAKLDDLLAACYKKNDFAIRFFQA